MKNKKLWLTIGVYVITFVVMIMGATFAYFSNIKTSIVTGVNDVNSGTMEILSFKSEGPLVIEAQEFNFGFGMDSLSSNSVTTAELRAGSEKVTHHYNIKLVIDSNDFVYSISENNAELLLKITDPEGNEVTQMDGLVHKTINDDSGFDITNKQGSYDVIENYEISTDDIVTQKWISELVFVNYLDKQDDNQGKTLIGRLVIETVD